MDLCDLREDGVRHVLDGMELIPWENGSRASRCRDTSDPRWLPVHLARPMRRLSDTVTRVGAAFSRRFAKCRKSDQGSMRASSFSSSIIATLSGRSDLVTAISFPRE